MSPPFLFRPGWSVYFLNTLFASPETAMYVCMYMYVYVCVQYVCMYMYVYVIVCVCMYIYMCVWMKISVKLKVNL